MELVIFPICNKICYCCCFCIIFLSLFAALCDAMFSSGIARHILRLMFSQYTHTSLLASVYVKKIQEKGRTFHGILQQSFAYNPSNIFARMRLV